MGLKWYEGLVSAPSYCPGMDDSNNPIRLGSIAPWPPPLDHGILPANHGIQVPSPSPVKSMLLPLPTTSTKGMEKAQNGSNIGVLVMDLAKDGSEDRTGTPAKEEAHQIPPAPTTKEACTILPAPTDTVACTTPPAAPGKEDSTTPEMTTDCE
jgi:hypothetical protein